MILRSSRKLLMHPLNSLSSQNTGLLGLIAEVPLLKVDFLSTKFNSHDQQKKKIATRDRKNLCA